MKNAKKIADNFLKEVSLEIRVKILYFEKWSKDRLAGLFVLNLFVILLVLLRSAGYFHPFLPLTINIVVLFSMIFGVVFLRLSSNVIFSISLMFLIFAGILRTLEVEVWAVRSAVYFFQSFVLGIILLFIEKTGEIVNENQK